MVWDVLEEEPVSVRSDVQPQLWGRSGGPRTALPHLHRLNASVLRQGESWGLILTMRNLS